MEKFLKYYLPVLIWMGVIFSFSAMSGNGEGGEASSWFYIERKGAHVFEYFILTFLVLRVFGLHSGFTNRRKVILSIIFSLAYACSDEFHQLFVSGRQGKISDVGIDLIGIALMILLLNIWRSKRQKED